MKICAAQLEPLKGDMEKNIEAHLRFINAAVAAGIDIIVFPELSLTAYEPWLAKQLAIHLEDSRLDVFQASSDAGKIVITVGVPVKAGYGVYIGMIIFQPNQSRQLYSKKFLHEDEKPFFIEGKAGETLLVNNRKISFAICYEVFVPEHAAIAFQNGAELYLASVAKSAKGVEKAKQRLPETAASYQMTVLMANSVGYCDNFESAGQSTVWNSKGIMIDSLDDKEEGLLIIDTQTGNAEKKIFR